MADMIQDQNTGNTLIIINGYVLIHHAGSHNLTDTEGNILGNTVFTDDAIKLAHKLVADTTQD